MKFVVLGLDFKVQIQTILKKEDIIPRLRHCYKTVCLQNFLKSPGRKTAFLIVFRRLILLVKK